MKKIVKILFLSLTILLVNVASAKDEEKYIVKGYAIGQQGDVVYYDNYREKEKEKPVKNDTIGQQGDVVHYDNNRELTIKK
ncbi:MAG: hypothetical protein NTZ60_00885 [Campylobacterales bacterium]|nr:hypothetical protein [Campylobacterales bacterium]